MFFMLANPTPLRLKAVLEINSDQPVLPLAGSETLKISAGSGSQKIMALELAPIRTGGRQVDSRTWKSSRIKSKIRRKRNERISQISGKKSGVVVRPESGRHAGPGCPGIFDARLAALDQALAGHAYGQAYAILTRTGSGGYTARICITATCRPIRGCFLLTAGGVSKSSNTRRLGQQCALGQAGPECRLAPIPADDPTSGRIGVQAVYRPAMATALLPGQPHSCASSGKYSYGLGMTAARAFSWTAAPGLRSEITSAHHARSDTGGYESSGRRA